MNYTQSFVMTDQIRTLQGYLDKLDRVDYYVKLHEYTGSTTALMMAQISSSSDLLGGAE